MLKLPKSKLGEVTSITMTSPDLNRSLKYYQDLGFREVMRSDMPFPWIQVSDGALLIMLRYEKNPYCALTYYVKDITKSIKMVEEAGIVFTERPKETDLVKRYLFRSPDGLNISLVNIFDGFEQPPGPTMLTMSENDYFNPDKYVNKTCGIYGEFAHPVKDLTRSIFFWEKLGFTTISKFNGPYHWAILSDGLAVIGLHQTTNFTYPVITFFAADMNSKIEKLRKKGVPDISEQQGGNIVLSTPEKQKINLFRLGM